MNDAPRLYKNLRAGDRVLPDWQENRRVLMSEDEWLALSDQRRSEIVMMYERFKRNQRIS